MQTSNACVITIVCNKIKEKTPDATETKADTVINIKYARQIEHHQKYLRKQSKTLTKIVHNCKEFPYGSAVSINGRDFDQHKWPDKNEAPALLRIIQNPDHHNGREAEEINEETESFVIFVVLGHYEWNDTAMLNTVSGKFNNDLLNIISYPPRDTKLIRYRGKTDPLRHFVKGHGKWDLRNHQNPCLRCGSPWCEYKRNKKEIKK